MSQSRIFLGKIFPQTGTNIESFLKDVNARVSLFSNNYYDVQIEYGMLDRYNDPSIAEVKEFGARITALEKRAPEDSIERLLRDAQDQIQGLLNERAQNWEQISTMNGQLLRLRENRDILERNLEDSKVRERDLLFQANQLSAKVDQLLKYAEQDDLVEAYRECVYRMKKLQDTVENDCTESSFDGVDYYSLKKEDVDETMTGINVVDCEPEVWDFGWYDWLHPRMAKDQSEQAPRTR